MLLSVIGWEDVAFSDAASPLPPGRNVSPAAAATFRYNRRRSGSSSPCFLLVCGWRRGASPERIVETLRHAVVRHLFLKSSSTTEESASVEMSPRSFSSQAIFRSTRRMIFPAETMKSLQCMHENMMYSISKHATPKEKLDRLLI